MKNFSNKITLIKNNRGVYDLDTSKGCFHGVKNNTNGCYGDCYALRNLKQYGFDFSKSIDRKFDNIEDLILIRTQILNIDMPFIRIGVSGDPSHNWENLINVISLIYELGKKIVIITKHWEELSKSQLVKLSKYNVFINTSISALDSSELINNRLKQYNLLKDYCNSILRIISCDFNKRNLTGLYLNSIQELLFKNKNTIDTVLRISKNNILIKSRIINIERIKFLGSYCYASVHNKNTYLDYCDKCDELCGINF